MIKIPATKDCPQINLPHLTIINPERKEGDAPLWTAEFADHKQAVPGFDSKEKVIEWLRKLFGPARIWAVPTAPKKAKAKPKTVNLSGKRSR